MPVEEVRKLKEVEGFVAKVESISQGGSLPVEFTWDNEPTQGRTCTIYVKQHIKDNATIVRQLDVDPEDSTKWSGLLTSADTAQFKIGQWNVFASLNDATTQEARQVKSGSIRFDVTETIFTTINTPISSVVSGTGAVARFNFSGTIVSVGQTVTISGYTAGAAPYNGDQVITATDVGGNEWFETVEVFTIDQSTGSFAHLG